MPKTSHLPPISPEPHLQIQPDTLAHQRAWQRHVDAGRIGSTPALTFERRVKMMRREVALFGRVRTRALIEF